MTLERIEAVRAMPGYRLHLRFAGGMEGIANLAPLIAQGGVFTTVQAAFEAVRIIEHGRALAWRDAEGDDVDLCADALRQMMRVERAAAE